MKNRISLIPCIALLLITSFSFADSFKVFMGAETYPPSDIRNSSSVYGTANAAIFGTLLNLSDVKELLPGLITQWRYDYHQKKYFITLGNSKFHNGREINARDLEFSVIRGLISSVENYHRIYFSDILGADKLTPGMSYVSGMLSGFKIKDDKNVEITLKNINPVFLIHFASPFINLVPREELGLDLFSWKRFPIGAGPYRIEKEFQDSVLALKRIVPQNNRMDLIELHTNQKNVEYDLTFDRVDRSRLKGNLRIVYSKYPTSVSTLFFYRTNDLSKNINFRKAVFYGINRDSVAKGFENYKPAFELVLPPYTCRKSVYNRFDFKLAKRYFDRIPKKLLKKDIKVGVFTDDVILSPLRVRLDRIAADLKNLGLNVVFEANTDPYPTGHVLNKFTMKLWSKNVDLDDPVIIYGSMTSLSPFRDEVPDTHGTLDRLYQEVASQPSLEKRFAKINRLASFVDEQTLAVPLLLKYASYFLNDKTIKNFIVLLVS